VLKSVCGARFTKHENSCLWLEWDFFLDLIVPAWSMSEAEKEVYYWRQTGLSRLQVLGLINNRSCSKSGDAFKLCLLVLDAIAGQLRPALQLAVDQKKEAPERLRSVGSVGFLPKEVLADDQSLRNGFQTKLRLENEKNERRKQLELYEQIYLIHRETQLDIDKAVINLYDKLLSEPGNENRESAITAAAINNYLKFTDPHTYIIDEKSFNDLQSNKINDIKKSSLGLLVMPLGNKLYLRALKGSPAENAGIMDNDVLLGIDTAVFDQSPSVDQVAPLLLGDPGTKVTLKIQRGDNLLEVVVQRAAVTTDIVVPEFIQHMGRLYGYIALIDFLNTDENQSTCKQIKTAILEVERQGAEGIVLDLRNNGGGFLAQASCVAGLFSGENRIAAKVRNLKENSMLLMMTDHQQVTKLNLVVLINSFTASVAEVVAGFFQEVQRAWIVGEQSFGKGTAQDAVVIGGSKENRVLLFYTSHQFYQSSGLSHQGRGITPDFDVPIDPSLSSDELWRPREMDLYENAIANDTQIKWTQSRPEEVKKIKECVHNKNLTEPVYQIEKAKPFGTDYQVLMAESVLFCTQ
jgi:C-terminal peptidase prc